jgi:hypothetical protein
VPCHIFFPSLLLQSPSAALHCRLHCSLNPVRFATIYDLILKFDLDNGLENSNTCRVKRFFLFEYSRSVSYCYSRVGCSLL